MHHLPNQRVKFDRDYNNRLKSAKGGEDKDDVVAYSAHMPSFADTWGWVMASDQPFCFNAEEIDRRVDERIDGELLLLNGAAFLSSATLNKAVSQSLLNETHVYTEDNARFLHGHGVANKN
ncbi:hypothetical protein OIU78_023862 [Salix suchowensis]|nr:hypothetical protein OIU78_023862 [Salix suchowensis]